MPLPQVLEIKPLARPIDAVVHLPGSKSYTNRALAVAALALGGVSRLRNPLEADDTEAMRESLRNLGVLIDDNDDPWLVVGTGGEFETPDHPLDARGSGTTARFITAIAVLAGGPVTVDGSARMRERPIADLTDALTRLGAKVATNGGFPPVTVDGREIAGGSVTVDGSRSSQFVSALMMLGPMLSGGIDVTITGEMVSTPYLTSTVEVMRAFGAEVAPAAGGYSIGGGGYVRTEYEIEADASAAAYPALAAAVRGGQVTLVGLPPDSSQADMAFLGVLADMGCVINHSGGLITVTGPSNGLRAVDVDMSAAPDASLALAVGCLFADGESRIRGLSTLRHKETDRLVALENELNRLGATARIDGSDLLITPGPPKAARISTYDDHRMAMAFAVAGLARPGIEIDDPACVAKTWPRFFQMLESLR